MIQLPRTRGKDALEFLRHWGLEARIPSIRSSDFESCLSNPFGYYVRRRLGLSSAITTSPALKTGTYFHYILEYDDFQGDTLSEARRTLIREHHRKDLDQASARLREAGLGPDAIEKYRLKDEELLTLAFATYDAASQIHVPIPGLTSLNFREYLRNPNWRILDRELLVAYTDPKWPRTSLLAQYDLLLYHVKTKQVWAFDAKTTSDDTVTRLQRCPLEYQTQHYTYILDRMLPTLIKVYKLPEDAEVGGMIHMAVQKPTIKISGSDRNYTDETRVLKSGPNKGQPKTERKYYGEPVYSNYLSRCQDWMLGQGEYLHFAPERQTQPCVNFSWTNASYLDSEMAHEYEIRTDLIYHYATMIPEPGNFPRTSKVDHYGFIDFIGDMALNPVSHWPDILEQNLIIIDHRDDIIGPTTRLFSKETK